MAYRQGQKIEQNREESLTGRVFDDKICIMNAIKRAIEILLIFLFGTVFCGCGEQEEALKIKFNEINTSTGQKLLDRKQEVLRLAISSMISPRETIYCYQDIFDYVSEKLNRKIEIVQKETYGETNELLRQGEVDAAMVCSGAYVEAHASYGAELLAAPKPVSDRTYCSYIIVHRDSQINSIEGLKGRTFAFTDSLSNTGRLYPVWLLSRKGYKPETYFARYIYSGSHDNSIRAVSDGLIDGAAVDSLIFLYLNYSHPDVISATKVIAVSPVFGLPPLIVHPRMDVELKKILREILLSMHNDEKGRVLLNKIKIERFIIPQDNDYDSIREMKKAVGYE